MLAQMTHEERERLRAEFLRQTSEGFDRMFDPNRQSDMRTFTQREDRGMDIGTGLARWVIEQHVGEDAEAKPSVAGKVCPDCGGPAAASGEGDPPAREVVSRAGEVAVHRPGHVCPRCRRTFFPLDRELDLGTEGYSPALLARIEYAGGNAPSFEQGSERGSARQTFRSFRRSGSCGTRTRN